MLGIILFVFGGLFLMCGWPVMRCEAMGLEMGAPTKHSFIAGCMVKAEGRWVPMENYRVEP